MRMLLAVSLLLFLVSFVGYIWLVVRAFKKEVLWGFGVLLLSPIVAVVFAVKYWREAKKPFLVYITSSVAAFAVSVYVFMAWGGWQIMGTAMQVTKGIEQQTLTEKDALRFMQSGLDFAENAAATDEEKQKVAVMREFLEQADSGPAGQGRQETSRQLMNTAEPPGSAPEAQGGAVPSQENTEQPEKAFQPEGPLESELIESIQSRESAAPPEPSGPALLGKFFPSFVSKSDAATPKKISVAQAGRHIGESIMVSDKNGGEMLGVLVEVSGNTLRFENRLHGGIFSVAYGKHEIESLLLMNP